jgi:hypothetical protein
MPVSVVEAEIDSQVPGKVSLCTGAWTGPVEPVYAAGQDATSALTPPAVSQQSRVQKSEKGESRLIHLK